MDQNETNVNWELYGNEMYESGFRKELISFLKLKTEYRNGDALPIHPRLLLWKRE